MSRAVLIGADLAFGAEIAARLRGDGFDLEGDLHGSIDALVVNAPVALANIAFDDITDDQFRAALDHQLYAAVIAAQVAQIVQGGSIVHVGSRAHLGGWGGAHQMAAGAALIAMSRSMALEYADAGVRVNCVAPDFVNGEVDAQRVADVVAFLAGPASGGVSGETILVDAGRSLRMSESARRQDIA